MKKFPFYLVEQMDGRYFEFSFNGRVWYKLIGYSGSSIGLTYIAYQSVISGKAFEVSPFDDNSPVFFRYP